jgi:hypothetical protein
MRQITLSEEDGYVVAEWYPRQTGMPIVGRGETVLEAVGCLVVYDSLVELRCSPLVDSRFSVREPAAPRR